MRRKCPTHRSQDADDCRFCEEMIAATEAADIRGDEDAAQRQYERWLDRMGGVE